MRNQDPAAIGEQPSSRRFDPRIVAAQVPPGNSMPARKIAKERDRGESPTASQGLSRRLLRK
jgi:hypothetical protein